MLSRIICACRALDINLAFLDTKKSENILESYSLKQWGGMGMSVPYYMYFKDGVAHHLKQQIFSAIKFVEAIDAINIKGETFHSEPLRYARTEYTIYWEYIKREAGQS